MSSSVTSLTLPGYDIPWLLPRSCAGEWPFDPRWKGIARHPSMRHMFERISAVFLVPDFRDRTVQVAVEVVRREARKRLEHREVKHFEVVPIRDEGFKPLPHQKCEEKGCDMCQGLGAVFVPSSGAVATLMGWVAIVRVEE